MTTLLAHAALVAVPFLASGNTILARMAFVNYHGDPGTVPLHPLTLAIARCMISVSVFSVLLWREQNNAVTGENATTTEEPPAAVAEAEIPSLIDRLWLVILGVVGITLNFFFFLSGIQLLHGVQVAGWMATVPVTTAVIASYLGYEAWVWAVKFPPILFVIVGNILLSHLWKIFAPSEDDDPKQSHSDVLKLVLGCGCMILNTVCFSYYLVATKPVARKFSIVTFTWAVQLSGFVGLLLISLCYEENIVTSQLLSFAFNTGTRLAPISWVAIGYAGFVQSSITYALLGYGIKYTGSPVLASLLNNLQPTLVVLEAMLILDETMDSYQGAGAGIILVGLFWAMYTSIKESQDAAAAAVKADAAAVEMQKQEAVDMPPPRAQVHDE